MRLRPFSLRELSDVRPAGGGRAALRGARASGRRPERDRATAASSRSSPRSARSSRRPSVCWRAPQRLAQEIEEHRELAHGKDADLRELARAELPALEARLAELDATLRRLLLPKDPNDERNTVARDPRRHRRRRGEPLRRRALPHVHALRRAAAAGASRSCRSSPTGLGGFKEVIALVAGEGRLQPAQVRGRRAPRAARAGHRDAGPHPHLGRDGRGPARGRGRRGRHRPTRTSASTSSAPRAPAARASTRPTRRCASRTCRPASS